MDWSRVIGRIALTAYILGGMIASGFHRQGDCGPCAVVCRGIEHAALGDDSPRGRCAAEHAAPSAKDAEALHASHAAVSLKFHDASLPVLRSFLVDDRCASDCALCIFSGSSQIGLERGDSTLVDRSSEMRVEPVSQTDASQPEGSPRMLRGPPMTGAAAR